MKKTNRIAIIGALDAEIDQYLQHLEKPTEHHWNQFIFHQGVFGGKDIIIVKSGIGKVFAALTTQKLIDTYDPRCVIFTGVAGGLDPNINIGDIVIAKDCVQHDLDARELGFSRGTIPFTDYRFFETDQYLRSLALSTPTNQVIHEGRILTGDNFLTQKNLKRCEYLTKELNGSAVEMEGASVGQVCTINNIPFLIIRTISDHADQHAPVDFNQLTPIVAKNSFHIVNHLIKSI